MLCLLRTFEAKPRALLDLVRGLTSTLEPEEVAGLLVLTLAGRWAIGKYALAVSKGDTRLCLGGRELCCPTLKRRSH